MVATDRDACAALPAKALERPDAIEDFKARRSGRALCSEIVRGEIWNPDSKLATGDEMRDRIIGALDTGCRRGEMMKIQNRHVDWEHRWMRILKCANSLAESMRQARQRRAYRTAQAKVENVQVG